MPYADLNDLRMYYETHGDGEPLVVIPGGLMTSAMMSPLVQVLAQSRQVIAIEPQVALAYGRRRPATRLRAYGG